MNKQEFKAVTLGSLAPKSVFNYGGVDWLVLDHAGDGVLCLAKEPVFERAFDTDNYNNWEGSSLREELNNGFLEALEKEGADLKNFLPLITDLTADDGLTDYDRCEDTVTLISCEQYRKYRAIIPNADGWWWTCTPYSTKSNGYSCDVRGVDSDGTLYYGYACGGSGGVRPLCNLSSSILVSTPDGVTSYAQYVSEDVENSTEERAEECSNVQEPAVDRETKVRELAENLAECIKVAQDKYKVDGGDLLEIVNATGAIMNIWRALQ